MTAMLYFPDHSVSMAALINDNNSDRLQASWVWGGPLGPRAMPVVVHREELVLIRLLPDML